MEQLLEPRLWAQIAQIAGIDILLSGDNALVIALACRSLPPKQRRIGIFFGAGAAVGLRILFAIFIVYLLTVPYLKLLGGALLFWIAYKLVVPNDEHGDAEKIDAGGTLWQAVRTVVIADAVMSLDNVVAIAAAAKGQIELLVFGLALSIPLIVYGSTLILKLLDRYPLVITAGGGLLGYIAGDVMLSDPTLTALVTRTPSLHHIAGWVGAAVIVAIGLLMSRRAKAVEG